MYPHHPFNTHPHPHEHPGWPHAMYRYHRGPSRIFWFFLGGIAATVWLKWKERERRGVEYSSHGWWSNSRNRLEARDSQGDVERATAERWREERERIARISSQATDTAADVSEAALDTILSTVESLKSKLAEHRELRQKPAPERRDDPEPPQHPI